MSKFTSLFIKDDKQVQSSNDVQNEVTAAPKRNFVQQPVTQSVEDGTPAQKSVDVPSTVATSGSISVDEKIVNMIWDKSLHPIAQAQIILNSKIMLMLLMTSLFQMNRS